MVRKLRIVVLHESLISRSGRVSKRNVPEGAIVYTAVLSGSISCVYLGTVAGFNTFLGGIVVCGFIAYRKYE